MLVTQTSKIVVTSDGLQLAALPLRLALLFACLLEQQELLFIDINTLQAQLHMHPWSAS